MGNPTNHLKPDLSSLASRNINLSARRLDLDWSLHQWISDLVRRTGQPPKNGNRPETILMATAQDSIDALVQGASTTMKLGQSGSGQTVYADFLWGRFPDGRWYISAVSFGLHLNAAARQIASQQALKQRLLDQAEIGNAKHLHLRQTVFPAEKHLHTWTTDISAGDKIISAAINRAYEAASDDGEALSNPVTWKAMALSLVSWGLAPAEARELDLNSLDAEERAAFDIMTKNPVSAVQLEHELREHLKEHTSPDRLFKLGELLYSTVEATEHLSEKEKSKGDKILDVLLDYSGFVPGAGPYIKTLAGMLLDVAISSDASRITRIRSRCYIYFVAGYISKLILVDTGKPKTKIDKKYFEIGASEASKVGSAPNFNAQLSLLHYASKHYTAGGWGGLGWEPQTWDFPDQYITKWSPELLGRALATQLHTKKYLVENYGSK